MQKDVLLLGANAPEMELLRGRLVRSGYRVVPAKTPEQAHTLLRVAGSRVGAVVVPSDLPAIDLAGALRFLRRLVSEPVTFVAAGRDPGSEGRRRLREAGVRVAIFDPIDLHSLRFQMNRALSDGRPVRGRRDTQRAPVDWPVIVHSGMRQKDGRLYSVSPTGTFVALQQPWMVRSTVQVRITASAIGSFTATGRVVMTNVPGNVMRRSLPFGMGVRFDQLPDAASVALMLYASERMQELAI
jgi:response regulator RpfG family c-di-GMP phosphodiesterase